MRMPRCAREPSTSRRMGNISSREAAGVAVRRAATRATAASNACSDDWMSPRMRPISASRCLAERAVKFASVRRTTMRVLIQTTAASKRKSAAMRIAALNVSRGGTGSPLFATAPHRSHRPCLALLLQRDVQLPRAALNGPRGGDVVLPLGAHLARALRLKARGVHLTEEPVEQVRGLIAAEKAVLVDESRKLEHHLVAGGDAGHDRLRVPAAKAALEAVHGLVEAPELRRGDERHERQYDCHSAPESHGSSPWFDDFRNGGRRAIILSDSII